MRRKANKPKEVNALLVYAPQEDKKLKKILI
jgi:hypothetical protein